METKTQPCHKIGYAKFKSYYVVWKQEDEENKKDKETKFKSYYVVWKRKYQEIRTGAY